MRAPISSNRTGNGMSSDHHYHQHHSNSSIFEMNNAAHSSGGSSSSSRLFVGTEYGADYVKLVAETIGITNLSEKCASQVGASVTFVIKELLEQSKKFASHARRKRVIADDFVEALKFRGHSPIFGLSSKEGVSYRLVGSTGRDLFINDDRDLDLSLIINAPPVKLPLQTHFKTHWLVIDGEQPAVPENPIPKYDEDLASTASSSVNEKVEQQQQNDIGGSHSLLSILSSQNTKKLRKIEQIQVKTITTHTLSLEQQIFFKEITEAIMGSDDSRRTEALHSLQTDAGIQILLPRFSLAIAEGVRCNIVHHNLAILIYLMRMIQSIASNPALSLDRCLHELLPSILSCILSKQLCARPETDNHWALREFSSRLLSTICRAYNVNGLRSRITQVLTRVWQEENSTLATLYGSIYALNELGIDTIRAVIVPRAPQLYNDIKKAQSDKSNPVDKVGAEKVYSFVTKVLTNYVRTQRPTGLKDVNDYRTMFGGFGDAIFRAMSIEVTQSHSSTSASAALSTNSSASVISHRPFPDNKRRAIPVSSLQSQAPSGVVVSQSPQMLSSASSQPSRIITSVNSSMKQDSSNPSNRVFVNNRLNQPPQQQQPQQSFRPQQSSNNIQSSYQNRML